MRPKRTRRSFFAAALIGFGWPWWALPDSDEKRRAYYRSGSWTRRKRRVWRRANGLCESRGCDRLGRDVHHLTYVRLYNERPGDLVLLCGWHHAVAHGRCGTVERPPACIWQVFRGLWHLIHGGPGLLCPRRRGIALAMIRRMWGPGLR
jgi:hypothetical protein